MLSSCRPLHAQRCSSFLATQPSRGQLASCHHLRSSSSRGSRPAQQQTNGSSSSANSARLDSRRSSRVAGSSRFSEAQEAMSMLLQLEYAQLLPWQGRAGRMTLSNSPKQFRQQLEALMLRYVLHSEAEDRAKGRAIDAVVQLLVQAGSRGELRLPGQSSAVTIDRVVVAGSVGKSVSVQGDFDVDLVAFLNLPAAAGVVVDLFNPENTQDSPWMQCFREQVRRDLQQQLSRCSGLRFVSAPELGRNAIKFTLLVAVPESGEQVELDVDVELAPNMSTWAGATAAAAWGVSASRGGTAAEVQRQAVLAPVLALAADAAKTGAASSATAAVVPSFARNIWLTEAATEFTQQAAVADAQQNGVPGSVVTSTICLMKAWVRKGLHDSGRVDLSWLKGWQVELFVLHAAERHACMPHLGYGRGYVLELLFETLNVVIEWADSVLVDMHIQLSCHMAAAPARSCLQGC